jgi:thiamine kinase-like enzyme
MNNLSDVGSFALAHYDIPFTAIHQLTEKAFKLTSKSQDYVLKFTDGSDDFLMKQQFAHKELSAHVLSIHKTRSGRLTAPFGNGFAYLTNFIERVGLPFEKQVSDYALLLRKLHEKTVLDIERHEVDIVDMYNKTFGELERQVKAVEAEMAKIEMQRSRSPFEWYLLMVYPMVHGMYRRVDDVMQKFYRGLNRKKLLPVCLCHGDVNVANLLSGVSNSYLINFEKSHFGMPTEDLALLLKSYHQVPGVRHMITDYLKSQSNKLVMQDFFLRTLCVDMATVLESRHGNAMLDISVVNEVIAPGIVAMQLYDELHAPKAKPKKEVGKNGQAQKDSKKEQS